MRTGSSSGRHTRREEREGREGEGREKRKREKHWKREKEKKGKGEKTKERGGLDSRRDRGAGRPRAAPVARSWTGATRGTRRTARCDRGV